MTIAPVQLAMPLQEFLLQYHDQPFEWINGERRRLMANVSEHSEIIRSVFVPLYRFGTTNSVGEAYNETTFILPDASRTDWVTGSRVPDVMFYTGDRLARYKRETPE